MLRRDKSAAQALGAPMVKRIREGRVLLIGAGGIGCELLKNLVCTGFGTGLQPAGQNGTTQARQPSNASRKPGIVVIDLDTIDLSNLNRQFLFRKHHIKKPKATVAKQTASQFNPHANIEAHHASIFDSPYNVSFFEGFDVVFNALDNLAARRHVNRMCLAADVPLIESGTTGFNGQVQAIRKGVTECYDCNPKPVQKSFPICTIRSTPSQPIHCIVWAKSYLLPELFGTSEEDSSDMAVTEADNAEEVAKLREEAQALKKIRAMMGRSEFAQAVFDKVFHEDIERLRSMTEMWQGKRSPEPLVFETLKGGRDLVKAGQALAIQDQHTWNKEENLAVFSYSLDALSNRVQAGENVIEFDKDDKDTLDFVASAANLRSHVFGIPLNSEWEIKQMAGNIIPAIATSNALTAGLCVLEAFKILRSTPASSDSFAKPTLNNQLPSKNPSTTGNTNTQKLLGGAKTVFLTSKNTERMITSEAISPPKPDCPVCSPVYAKLLLPNPGKPTLQDVRTLLLEQIGYEEFTITTAQGIVYDPDLDENLGKALDELGVDAGSNDFLTVSDDSDDPKVDLVLSVQAVEAREDMEISLLPASIKLPPKPKPPQADAKTDNAGPSELSASANVGGKRKRDAEEDIEGAKKRAKGDDGDQSVVLVVEDDGAILLDD